MYDKQIRWIYSIIDTLISFFRVLSSSKFKKTQMIEKRSSTCYVLGNGPSLSDSIQKYKTRISGNDVIAVNQMAATDLFSKYKPNIYILADPAYWYAKGYERDYEQADELYNSLVSKTTWELYLYLPYEADKSTVKNSIRHNNNIKIIYYNKTTFNGFNPIKYFIFNKQLGMVRPQNIINAALMLAIYSGFNEIYLMGADTDWMRNIWVDEKNRLRIHEKHFYEDKTQDRIIPVSMSHQCAAFYYTFKGYEEINNYALSKKIRIYNVFKYSFIDVFEKI